MKKMNLSFVRLSSKLVFSLILFLGLMIFTGQSLKAQYVSTDAAKEIVQKYVQDLPAAPLMNKASYDSNSKQAGKIAAVDMKRVFGNLILKNINDGTSVAMAIDNAYVKFRDRVPANKLTILNEVKADYVRLLDNGN